MPQPLSRVNPGVNINLGNNSDSPSRHRPALALLAMNVVAEWSILESFVTTLFTKMLGSSAEIGTEMYVALSGGAAQNAAFRAVADATLKGDEKDVFEAIFAEYKSISKMRNNIAHWVWGHSPELPDAALLIDPKHFTRWRVSFDKAIASRTGESLPDTPRDKIFVYRDSDFILISNKIQRLIGFVVDFNFVLSNHVANQGGQLLQRLLVEPEILEFVSRLREGRKTAPVVQPPPPQK